MDKEKVAVANAACGVRRTETRAGPVHVPAPSYQSNAWRRKYELGDAVCDACLDNPPCKMCICTPKLGSTYSTKHYKVR